MGSWSSGNPGNQPILNSIESDTRCLITTAKPIQSLLEFQRGFKAISQQGLIKSEEYPKKSFVSILYRDKEGFNKFDFPFIIVERRGIEFLFRKENGIIGNPT